MKAESGAFRAECDALHALLAPLTDADWQRPTQFKGWTINDVIAHLHAGNHSADLSLNDAAAHARMKQEWKRTAEAQNLTNLQMTHRWLDGLNGRALLAEWHAASHRLADDFAVADPRKRVPWAGREMSARSSISARLMETWAHGQEIYDLLSVRRSSTDDIRNIATLGINTFGWTFTNRASACSPPRAQPGPGKRSRQPEAALISSKAAQSSSARSSPRCATSPIPNSALQGIRRSCGCHWRSVSPVRPAIRRRRERASRRGFSVSDQKDGH